MFQRLPYMAIVNLVLLNPRQHRVILPLTAFFTTLLCQNNATARTKERLDNFAVQVTYSFTPVGPAWLVDVNTIDPHLNLTFQSFTHDLKEKIVSDLERIGYKPVSHASPLPPKSLKVHISANTNRVPKSPFGSIRLDRRIVCQISIQKGRRKYSKKIVLGVYREEYRFSRRTDITRWPNREVTEYSARSPLTTGTLWEMTDDAHVRWITWGLAAFDNSARFKELWDVSNAGGRIRLGIIWALAYSDNTNAVMELVEDASAAPAEFAEMHFLMPRLDTHLLKSLRVDDVVARRRSILVMRMVLEKLRTEYISSRDKKMKVSARRRYRQLIVLLFRCLKDEATAVRADVAEVLGESGDKRALLVLKRALANESDDDVRKKLFGAIKSLGGKPE